MIPHADTMSTGHPSKDLVTYIIPVRNGQQHVHRESSVVPRPGDPVWIEDDGEELGEYVVTDVHFAVYDNQVQAQVIVRDE